MKRDLHISDTQIGMLQGLAFALLYTFLGLPIARLSDRYSRRGIIAAGVLTWSFMATLCGLARTAIQLFIARIGVGAGEAALSPAAYSIITDSFPRSKLGRAFGFYNIGITIGSGIAFLVGGIVVAAVSRAGASYTLPLLGEVRAFQRTLRRSPTNSPAASARSCRRCWIRNRAMSGIRPAKGGKIASGSWTPPPPPPRGPFGWDLTKHRSSAVFYQPA